MNHQLGSSIRNQNHGRYRPPAHGRPQVVGSDEYVRIGAHSSQYQPHAQYTSQNWYPSGPESRGGYHNHAPSRHGHQVVEQIGQSHVPQGEETDLGVATGVNTRQEPRSQPVQMETLRPIDPPKGYPTLDWLPLFLRAWLNIICCLAYAVTAAGIVTLLCFADGRRQYYTENENAFLAVRYGPSVLGTITSILFRTTAQEFYRICRYAIMADTKKSKAGAIARRSIMARYYPLSTPSAFNWRVTTCVELTQFISGFIVASKASLLTVERMGTGWKVSVHKISAYFLVVSHTVMLLCTLLLIVWLSRHPSGLMWDPAALADEVALFTQCGTIKQAAPFELPRESPRRLHGSYRLGYWMKSTPNSTDNQVLVYGIGKVSKDTDIQFGPAYAGAGIQHSYERVETGDRREDDTHTGQSTPLHQSGSHICTCVKRKTCDHYPYRHMPFVGYVVFFWQILIYASLILLLISICRGHYNGAFWVTNSFHSRRGTGNSSNLNGTSVSINKTVTSTDQFYDDFGMMRGGNGNEVWIYALLYRSIPTLFASMFATGFLFSLDRNHRFVQPFLAMRQPNGGTPDETILNTYTTDSSLELPGKAIAAGHFKVAYHSLLFAISPLFPIYVASLYTIANNGERIYFTYSPFSLNMVLVYLVTYAVTVSLPWPSAHRLMPRMNYNLMETVALCHASSFAASADMLDNNIPNATQSYMYDRIRLRYKNIQDRFIYGQYLGTDGKLHMGFDIAEKAGKSTDTVQHIPVEKSKKRWFGPMRRRRMPEKRMQATPEAKDEEDASIEMPMWSTGRGTEGWYNESTRYERLAK